MSNIKPTLPQSSQVTFIYIALVTIQIVTKKLHNIKIGKLCQKCKMTRFNTQFSAEGISLLNLVMHRPAQFSLNNICAMKSMILLEMKCPQLSKPEAIAARNQNSIGDRMEKKPWAKPGSVFSVPLWPDEQVVCSNCSKVRL